MLNSGLALCIVALALWGCGGDGDGDDAIEEGRQARVNGIEYSVLRTRPLNLHAEPDQAYYQGPSPGAGRIVLAVWVTACNVVDTPRRTTPDYFMVDNPFETRFEPKSLEADNPFAYRATELQPGRCSPGPNSAAQQGPGAALMIFEVPTDALGNSPLELVLDEADGPAELAGAKRIRLDL